MTGFLTSIPVILSIVIAAVLPVSALPGGAAEAFREGGWGMRLILFAFLVSLYLTVDRVLLVLRTRIDARDLGDRLTSMLRGGDVASALQTCAQHDRPLTRIIAAGLSKADQGAKRVQSAMDEQAYHEIPEIEKRTGYLALMGNIATLMGLFGTIIGLIHSFGAVSKTETSDNATLLAAGISEAMNCTAFGLLTGIAALVAFSVLNGWTQGMIDEINFSSLRVFRAWKWGAQQQGKVPVSQERQPIGAPHAHLMAHTGLLKAKGGGHGKKSTFASLQLTPLIDMFIVMVIFLLMSFSASGEIVGANKDIKLPFAQKADKLERVPVVAISHPPGDSSGGIVTLENHEVATAKELMEDSGPDWKIAKLSEQLEVLKNNWKVTNPDKPWEGELIVQADQNVDFKIIKKVMYSAGIAGYGKLMFAVRKSEKGGGGAEGGES